MGSVVFLCEITNKVRKDLWLLQEPLFHNLIDYGISTLDGYNIMAKNPNLYAE